MTRSVQASYLCVAAILLLVGCHRPEPSETTGSAEPAAAPMAPVTYALRTKVRQPIQAGAPSGMTVSVVTSDGRPATLEQTYNASLHVVVVSRDLRWYTHLHADESPVTDSPLAITFPADGEYVLFAYFQPVGGEVETRTIPVRVGSSTAPRPAPALRNTSTVHTERGYRIEMIASPVPLRPNVWESFTFHMSRGGAPIANLGSEGALGHLAIVAEEAKDFVFAHSTVEEAGGVRSAMHMPMHPALANETFHAMQPVGPDATFHARFPHPGHYKLWAEFTPGDDVTAEFVVTVSP